jgi:predicted Zn-dependent protease
MRIFSIIVGLFIAFFACAGDAFAFVLIQSGTTGKKVSWGEVDSGKTITVTYGVAADGTPSHFEAGSKLGSLDSLAAANGFAPDDFETQLRRAFAAWSAAIPLEFRAVEDPATADIRVGTRRIDGAGRRVANTYIEFSSAPGRAERITRSEIHFDVAEKWAPGPTRKFGTFDLFYVALHEIGHALGLDDLAASTDAVMHPRYQRHLRDLQAGDIAGAQALYGSPPVLMANAAKPAAAPLGMTAPAGR